MEIREKIKAKLTHFNFKHHEYQIEVIEQIISHYLNGTEYVFLLAPTGSGKSVVAYIAAEVLGDIINEKDDYEDYHSLLYSNILIHNNTLLKQYNQLLENTQNITSVLGADNYNCGVLNSSAKYCIKDHIYEKNPHLSEICDECEYRQSRNRINETQHLITNYQYFFVSRLFANTLDRRLLTIYDECHLINDVFCQVYSIDISKDRLNTVCEEIDDEAYQAGSEHIYNAQERLYKVDLENNNYQQNVRLLNEGYNFAHKHFNRIAKTSLNGNNFQEYVRYKNLANKYDNFSCKTADFLKYEYPHVVDPHDGGGYIIKPIFLSNLFGLIKNSPFHLFMSATITPEFLTRTIGFGKDADIKFIQMKSIFEPSRKQVRFINSHKLNYKQTNDPEVLDDVANMCHSIISEHMNEKGIIQASSFKLSKAICDRLRKLYKKSKLKIFEHKRGDNLDNLIHKFRKSDEPAVLISPSIFVGVDLPDSDSRYQIMLKAPYASLSDTRMQYIIKNHPVVYQIDTLFKILQGFGRSNRNKQDYSVTYCIDSNIEKIFNTAPREIKNQFETYSY